VGKAKRAHRPIDELILFTWARRFCGFAHPTIIAFALAMPLAARIRFELE